ncbi:MAG: LemA family protein [Candidatus Aenigmarchaeota archaeon]|nr:LemA family protein [Candidatus Aenigmarchaeota archaeon]MBU5689153.1 LemA family protein [Candidatus Aenigmarchaeota archaeon]
MIVLLIALLLLVILVPIFYINRIIVLSNRIDNAWSQIDVQLKKRADLVPNLIETVKGYMKHERKAIEMVTKAREEMMKVGTDIKARAKAEAQLTAALKTIFALSENYPKLKASENFKMLQEQLESIENKIAYARQFYNDSVLEYNNMTTTIPGMWFVGLSGKPKTREYFQIEEAERKPVKVEF